MTTPPRRVARSFAGAALAAAAWALVSCGGCGDGASVPGEGPGVAEAIGRMRAAHPERFRRRVVVLGFDSCDPDLVDDLIAAGKLPNFARLHREGAFGKLESIQPPLSPVVWTTVATGMRPERHGILDFVADQPEGGIAPVDATMRQADTVWEILSRHGETVGVVGWLVTWPAEPVNGFVVTDRMGLLAFDYGRELDTTDARRAYPPDLAAEVERLRVDAQSLPLWKARPFADVSPAEWAGTWSPTYHPLNRLGNLRLTLATAETFRAAGQKLWDERRPRFFALYFEAMDALSHTFMRFAPPKLPDVSEADYLKYRTAIEANYAWHDQVLGEFLDRADADTTLFVVSDHGFQNGEGRRGDPSDFHAKTGAMWHRPYGVFYAWGNGVARRRKIAGASVLDVTPTILAAMGYPKPRDMPGNVLEQAFEGGLPCEEVDTYYGESRRKALVEARVAGGTQAESPEAAAEMAKLQAMGYISADPNRPSTTSLNLGQSYLRAGRIDDAIAAFRRAVAAHRGPGTLGALAGTLLARGGIDEAEKLLDEALAAEPGDVGCRLTRVHLLLARGRPDEAEALARALVQERPDLQHTHGRLAMVLDARAADAERAGDPARAAKLRAEALGEHEAVLRIEPNAIPSLFEAAQSILMNPADPTGPLRALRLLDSILELEPEHPSARNARSIAVLRLGVVSALAGRVAEANQFYEQAVADATRAADSWRRATGREYARAWANRGYALWKLDRLDEAFAAAKKARETIPSYDFNDQFEASLAASGRPIPAPEPRPAAPPGPEPPK